MLRRALQCPACSHELRLPQLVLPNSRVQCRHCGVSLSLRLPGSSISFHASFFLLLLLLHKLLERNLASDLGPLPAEVSISLAVLVTAVLGLTFRYVGNATIGTPVSLTRTAAVCIRLQRLSGALGLLATAITLGLWLTAYGKYPLATLAGAILGVAQIVLFTAVVLLELALPRPRSAELDKAA